MAELNNLGGLQTPPPPPEVKVRTMRSDLESMAKSGGGLPTFQNVHVTGLSIENAPREVAHAVDENLYEAQKASQASHAGQPSPGAAFSGMFADSAPAGTAPLGMPPSSSTIPSASPGIPASSMPAAQDTASREEAPIPPNQFQAPVQNGNPVASEHASEAPKKDIYPILIVAVVAILAFGAVAYFAYISFFSGK